MEVSLFHIIIKYSKEKNNNQVFSLEPLLNWGGFFVDLRSMFFIRWFYYTPKGVVLGDSCYNHYAIFIIFRFLPFKTSEKLA